MTAAGSDGFDLIVVGLGAMGAATLYQAAKAGLRVLGIDRHDPPHDFGSSHAESRVSRLAVGEGPQYLPFVARSHEIWREIEAATGETILHETGGYIINQQSVSDDDRWGNFVDRTARIARRATIDYELHDQAEIQRRFPAITVAANERGGYEPSGGIVMCERAVASQLQLAQQLGAQVQVNEPVIDVAPTASHVNVTTAATNYRAAHVVLSTGAWLPGQVAPVDAEALTVTRQVVCWFDVDDLATFSVGNFPFILWAGNTIEEYLGVFPIAPDATPALKLLGEQFAETTDPGSVDRVVHEHEVDDLYDRLVSRRLAGVRRSAVRSTVCLYTNTPDDHFLIDTHPDSERIIAMSPCSGHGFKHSAALGEAVASLIATGESALDLTPFRRDRLR